MTNNRPDQAGGPATSTALIIVNLDNVDSPPMVGITSPADGDGVSGASVTITADATDENGVERVEFWVDSTWIREDTDGTHGWSAIWDLTSVADGHCSITATASDGWQTDSVGQCVVVLSGINKKTASVTFTVDSISATGYVYTGCDSVQVGKPQ